MIGDVVLVTLVDVAPEHVEGWAEELASLTTGLGYMFARPEPREVLADLGRKNSWTMAERAGHATPHRIQKFHGVGVLGRGRAAGRGPCVTARTRNGQRAGDDEADAEAAKDVCRARGN